MWGVLNGIITIIGILFFIAIIWWAYAGFRTKANDEAALLPFSLEDEENLNANSQRKETNHE